MKKALLTIITVLLLILNSACLVWGICEGRCVNTALSGFALGTLFMSLLNLSIS